MNRYFYKDIWVTNKHTKNCSTSLVFIEMQNKATMSYHGIPTKMDIIKKTVSNKRWWRCGEIEIPCIAGGNINEHTTLKNSLAVLQKIKHKINKWPSSFTLRYLPKRNGNMCPHKNLYMNVTAALSIIAERLRQPNIQQMNE